MNIKEIVKKYIELGNNLRNAQNLAAEEIILNKIASSELSQCVTLKGGIVMYNLTKSNRRVTQDIDFDLIKYSIDEKSIRLFVNRLSKQNDGITASMIGSIEKLHQEDYNGVRVRLLLKDTYGESLKIKLDIGVHTYLSIEQEKTVFSFQSGSETLSLMVNPCEQIFAEKLLSIARLGILTTRYKDIYDLYYLIKNNHLSIDKVRTILELFFAGSKRKPNDMADLKDAIKRALNNKIFMVDVDKPTYRWLDDSIDNIKDTIIDFIDRL